MSTYAVASFTTTEVLIAGRHVILRAKGKRLHRSLLVALTAVERTQEALESANRSKQQEDDPLASADAGKRSARGMSAPMQKLRKSLGAVAQILRAQSRLPIGNATGDRARQLDAGLFLADRACLQTGTASDLDVHAGRMLERAREKSTAASLAALGCAALVKEARTAHAELGAAREASEDEAPTETRAFAEAVTALREYARLVQAVDAVEGTSNATELLAPLANKRRPKRAPKKETPVAPSAPEEAPTPADDAATDLDEAPPSRAA